MRNASLALVLALAACTGSPVSRVAEATATPEPSQEPPASTGANEPVERPDHTPGPVIDGSLLPDGLAESPEAEAAILSDAQINRIADRLAAGIAVDGSTFRYVLVIDPRDDLTEAAYREWRQSFDAGACSQAGGVARSTEDGAVCASGLVVRHERGALLVDTTTNSTP